MSSTPEEGAKKQEEGAKKQEGGTKNQEGGAKGGAKGGTKGGTKKEGGASKSFLDSVKILDVVRYTINLSRDLVQPSRLKAKKYDKDYVRKLLAIVWPGFFGKTSGVGRNQVWMLVMMSLVRTFLLKKSAASIFELVQTVYTKDAMRFKQHLKGAILLTIAGSACSSLFNYSKETLAVLFRSKLTSVIHEGYFKYMTYYHISNLPGRQAIRDPEERVTREVWSVSQRLTNVVSLLIQALPPIVVFTYQLYKWRGFKYAILPHLYLFLAYEGAQRLFPKNIGDLYRGQAMSQGGYYKAISRLQTHSEAVAALKGAPLEEEILLEKFAKVSSSTDKLHAALSRFGLIFKVAYTYGCRSWMTSFIMLPLLRASPASGSVGGQTSAQVSELRFTMQLMLEMMIGNGHLLTMHANAQHMVGTAKRISTFIDTLHKEGDRQAKANSTVMVTGDSIKFDQVQVFTPMGHHLVKDLSFEVKRGQNLLLTGHNGAGKSSIFRCLGGLWNVPEGTITKPGAEPGAEHTGTSGGLHDHIFYLPQKPYNVLGTLRDQLCYPKTASDVQLTTESLRGFLDQVDLGYLMEFDFESSGKGADINWQEKLSLGEQQRLAIARLFFHCPQFAILDECTSSVSTEMEAMLYRKCAQMSITCITICHRPALKQYHHFNLNLTGDGKGGWEWKVLDSPGDFVAVEHPAQKQANPADRAAEGGQTTTSFLEKRSLEYAALGDLKALPKRSSLSKLVSLLKVLLPGSGKQLLMLFMAIVLRTMCHEGYSRIMGKLYSSMISRDMGTFAKFSLLNVAQDMATAFVEEGVVYLQNHVGVIWNENITNFARSRLCKFNSFYTLRNLDKRISDPDQRITQELQELANDFSSVWGKAITPLIDITWFSFKLHSLLGLRGMSMLYGYVAACWVVLRFFMVDHATLNTKEKQLESRFKIVHSRLRSHSESVAFFGGGPREKIIADSKLNQLVSHMKHVRFKNNFFKFIFHCVNKDFDDPSSIMCAPEIVTTLFQLQYNISQKSSSITGDQTAGVVSNTFYVSSAANRTVHAFGKLTNLYEHLESLLGSSTRICQLFDVMTELEAQASSSSPPLSANEACSSIVCDGVDIVTPLGQNLAQDLSVSVEPGSSLLVTGPNAAGKTSFFRCLSGLWPLQKGTIHRPEGGVFLVPQLPYSVLGSLADQVTYPNRLRPRTADDENTILEALEKVGIGYLVERLGWDTVKPWESTLSLGEQQRLGIARLLYHKPAFGVLDECTDAVSADAETDLYKAMFDKNITCITISKRLALTDFHEKQLQLGVSNTNGWKLVTSL